jgi:hypothetical protein
VPRRGNSLSGAAGGSAPLYTRQQPAPGRFYLVQLEDGSCRLRTAAAASWLWPACKSLLAVDPVAHYDSSSFPPWLLWHGFSTEKQQPLGYGSGGLHCSGVIPWVVWLGVSPALHDPLGAINEQQLHVIGCPMVQLRSDTYMQCEDQSSRARVA